MALPHLGRTLVVTVAALLLAPLPANAAGLRDYKAQKHKERGPAVTDANCAQAYTARCQQDCGADAACRDACPAKAGPFCAKRKQKRHVETTKLVGKAASLGAGLVMLGVSSVPWSCDGVTKQGEGAYAIPWDRPSVIGMVGGGLISNDWRQLQNSSTYLATASLRLRVRFLGVSAMFSRLGEGSDYLDELDFGPTFYFANSIVTFGIQPSVLVSAGPGVETQFGKGMRTWTRLYLGRLVGVLDTMLGKVNGQWAYHGRLGAGLRLTPALFAIVAVDYRDVVGFDDLDISNAALQGVMVGIGGRYN